MAEYAGMIRSAWEAIEQGKLDTAQAILERLAEYRPRRLSWISAQAALLMEQKVSLSEIGALMTKKALLLYDYPGVQEYLAVSGRLAAQRRDEADQRRFAYMRAILTGRDESGIVPRLEAIRRSCLALLESDHQSCPVHMDAGQESCPLSVEEEDRRHALLRLARICYCTENYIGYVLSGWLLSVKYQEYKNNIRPWVKNLVNMGMLLEWLEGDWNCPLLTICRKEDQELRVLGGLLRQTGKQILLLEYDEEPGAAHMENIIDQLKQTADQEDAGLLFLLGAGKVLDELTMHRYARRNSGKLTWTDRDASGLAFGWYGNYLDYISGIYGEDCRQLIRQDCKVRFSVIIPARNSAATLRHTLRTCLEQDYAGDYEIIVSDNSIGHHAEVYELCRELNDSRIVYIKTPRDLPLPKSFEYAYLHACGEYVFALGSDDGLLPWALSSLEEVIEAYPQEEIIQWERGFYAWPGFNGGQQHQFTIPGSYEKNMLEVYYRDNIDYIAAVLNSPSEMYSLPMLYINSCFKRSYFQTLMDKTGRLWDGVCQDIYMGVVTACIHDRILNLRYPLSVAGMSSGSVGARSNTGEKTNEEFEKMMREVRTDNNVGGFCKTAAERLLPMTGTDTCSLYGTLLRMVSIGLLPESYLTEVFDWKKMFRRLADELDIRDVAFDRKIHDMRYAAMQHEEAFLAWFDKAIYAPMLDPHILDEERLQQAEQRKTYSNHCTDNGGMVLDASEYGVENIYDAVRLFVTLSELG